MWTPLRNDAKASPTPTGRLLRGAALLVVAVVTSAVAILSAEAAIKALARTEPRPVKVICQQAGLLAHHRIALRHCRGTPVHRPTTVGPTGGAPIGAPG